MDDCLGSCDEWKTKLSKEEYAVLRQQATEPPFLNAYWDCTKQGSYLCRACGSVLFSSKDKYDSGTGWPSFTNPISEERLRYQQDEKLPYPRTEVSCSRCGSHLGHLFRDGPQPTGLRYCVNSTSLRLKEE